MNRNILYLLTIIGAVERIYIFKSEFNSARDFYFVNSRLNFNGVINLLSAIGEEVKKIDQDLKDNSGFSLWSDIVGLRNKIVHDYRGIDKDLVWEIINNDLESLKLTCIKILTHIKPNKNELEPILSTEYYSHISYLINDLYK